MNIAILISGGGSNMQSLIEAPHGSPDHQIKLVISNRPDAAGLAKAAAAGIQTAVVDHMKYAGDRHKFEADLADTLMNHDIHHICLAGFMRILTPEFVARWSGNILNIHPSLLPKYPGLDTHSRALDQGDEKHGCSVHLVTGDLDAGPILGQASLNIRAEDTAESLAKRVLKLEHVLYPLVLKRYLAGDKSRLDL